MIGYRKGSDAASGGMVCTPPFCVFANAVRCPDYANSKHMAIIVLYAYR